MLAVTTMVGPTIMLNSGALLDFLDPSSSKFTIDDIAHGLSNICRYAGQCSQFYSVAEHSLHVSRVAKGHEFAALMHDAAEAFTGDITRPLKQLVPAFKRIEREIEKAIFARFGLPTDLPKAVKDADLRVLAAEQSQIMPVGTDDWARTEEILPASIRILHLAPDEAKRRFLEAFESLKMTPQNRGELCGRAIGCEN